MRNPEINNKSDEVEVRDFASDFLELCVQCAFFHFHNISGSLVQSKGCWLHQFGPNRKVFDIPVHQGHLHASLHFFIVVPGQAAGENHHFKAGWVGECQWPGVVLEQVFVKQALWTQLGLFAKQVLMLFNTDLHFSGSWVRVACASTFTRSMTHV